MRSIKAFLLTCIVAITLLITASCETWRQGCEGEIVVENPIPDTTLYVGEGSFKRDIFEPPEVFRHTNGEIKNITAREGDRFVIHVTTERSQVTGNFDVVVVKPVGEGKSFVEITATDGCAEGFGVTTSFNVTVKDTTQQ